jgi:hypothetical protein
MLILIKQISVIMPTFLFFVKCKELKRITNDNRNITENIKNNSNACSYGIRSKFADNNIHIERIK